MSKVNKIRINKHSCVAKKEIDLADDQITEMEYRNICYAIILHLIAILLFIAIIIVLIIKFYVIGR